MPPLLVLASGSPRRRALLGELGLPFTIDPSNIDEPVLPGLTPPELARELASRKAHSVLRRLPAGALVIGADTLVDLDGQVLNKPVDPDDAARMLRLLAGRSHRVHTGLCLCGEGVEEHAVVSTAVQMRPLTAEMIAAYVAGGEPLDKAGAYAAQGEGAAFIERVEGSFLAVVGLPLLSLRLMLHDAGIAVPARLDRLEALERGEPDGGD